MNNAIFNGIQTELLSISQDFASKKKPIITGVARAFKADARIIQQMRDLMPVITVVIKTPHWLNMYSVDIEIKSHPSEAYRLIHFKSAQTKDNADDEE